MQLHPDTTALVLIDVQEKLIPVMAQKEELILNLRILIQGAQILQIPIYWCEQYPQGLGPTIPELTELLDGISPISKTSFSACGDGNLLTLLKSSKRSQVMVCGIESHVCVFQTARDLHQEKYQVEVVLNATSSRSLLNKQAAAEKMTRMGIEITTVELALFDLLQSSKSPHFKSISHLVRSSSHE